MGFALKTKRLTRVGDEAGRLYFFAIRKEYFYVHEKLSELCSPCGRCLEYLNTCKPIVINGIIAGECDNYYYCDWCSYYDECMKGGCC